MNDISFWVQGRPAPSGSKTFMGHSDSGKAILAPGSNYFETRLDIYLNHDDPFPEHSAFLRVARSAKPLHDKYDSDIRWNIAKRASSKLTSLMEMCFENGIKSYNS